MVSASTDDGEIFREPVLCDDERSRRFVRELLGRIGDTWSLVVVSSLIDGPLRFTELMRAIPGISHRMLTHTLRSLERDGLVSRASFAEIPPRVEYRLTSLGSSLIEPIRGLVEWAERHQDEIDGYRRGYDGAAGTRSGNHSAVRTGPHSPEPAGETRE